MDDDQNKRDDRLNLAQEKAAGTRRVLVTTESGSRYIIDLDLMMLRRVHATTSTADDCLSVPLRRDGQLVKILRLYNLQVGSRAVFDLEPLGDPELVAFTRRETTEVISIEDFPAAAPDETGSR